MMMRKQRHQQQPSDDGNTLPMTLPVDGPQHPTGSPPSSGRRRKRPSLSATNTLPCPTLWMVHQKHGTWTLHSNVVVVFVLVGVTFVFGVHIYLLRQLSFHPPTDIEGILPVTAVASTSTIVDKGTHKGEVDNSSTTDGATANDESEKQQQKPSNGHRKLTPLRDIDRQQYTIRINTWKRNEQLILSIQHHITCPGVAQIQVVWCDQTDPPDELVQMMASNDNKLVIERHEVNSLNERYHIIHPAPTLGILSMDDDVLRSCESIDSGFFIWVQAPHRMVGFDYRTHEVNEDGSWKYGYLSTTQKANRYSMSLPRYAFIHRDYMNWYMTELPRPIFQRIHENFNCEDIAMSFFISSLTHGRPPLLADFWAMDGMVKLYSEKRISGNKGHKAFRDQCVNDFASMLELKETLQVAPVVYREHIMFDAGDKLENEQQLSTNHNDRQAAFLETIKEWHSLSNKEMMAKVAKMKAVTSARAMSAGLIEKSVPWQKRFVDAQK